MSKTPEEMAIDYCEPILSDDYAKAIGREDWIGTRCVRVGEGHEMYKVFLAGYQAAKDNYKDAISAYEDVAKQMLEEAVRIMTPTDQLADADKMINSLKKLDSSAPIDTNSIDTGTKMQWISVKDRLPEDGMEVLFHSPEKEMNCCFVGYRATENEYVDPEGNGLIARQIEKYYTHWMPLPKPPEEK